jgi:hypothetical protein
MLILSVSICCCDLHTFAAGAAPTASHAATTKAAHCTSSCCSTGITDPADDDSSPDSDDGGCSTCCIKGSGLKDTGNALLNGPITVVPIAVPPATAFFDLPNPPMITRPAAPPRHHVDPPTLFRLRCALVV